MKTSKKGKNVKKEKEIFRLPFPTRTKVGIRFTCDFLFKCHRGLLLCTGTRFKEPLNNCLGSESALLEDRI